MAEGQIGNTVMVLRMTFKSYEAIYGTFNHQAFQIYTPRHLTLDIYLPLHYDKWK